MEDVFLSYSSKDAARVQVLRDALTDHGFSVFWDHDVPPGTDWDTWIRQSLAQSRCALVAWTFQSIESRNVRHEAVIAEKQDKLLSVMLDPVPAERFPMGQYTLEAVNLTSWSGDTKAKEYLELLNWLESKLTPTWIRNTLESRDLAVSSERTRREAAETQVRLLRDQVARDAIERQTLAQERDAARTELVSAQAAAEQLQSKTGRVRRLLRYGAVAALCAGTGLAGYQLASTEGDAVPPSAVLNPQNSPPPQTETETAKADKPVQATDLTASDCRTAAIDRIRQIKVELDREGNHSNDFLFNRPPPLKDLIERGWATNQPRGWTLPDLDSLCIRRGRDSKWVQCNWSVAQEEVLPSLTQSQMQERSRLAANVLKDLQSRASR